MANNPKTLADKLIEGGMNPKTPINAPSHSIWVNTPKNEWKLWGGHNSGDISTVDVEGIKAKGYNDLRLVPNGENWDFNSRALNDEIAKKYGHEITRFPNEDTYGVARGKISLNRKGGYRSLFNNEEELNAYLNDTDAQEKNRIATNNDASQKLLNDYYDGKMDLDTLHDQLVKVHGNIKPAFEWLLKNRRQ